MEEDCDLEGLVNVVKFVIKRGRILVINLGTQYCP